MFWRRRRVWQSHKLKVDLPKLQAKGNHLFELTFKIVSLSIYIWITLLQSKHYLLDDLFIFFASKYEKPYTQQMGFDILKKK